MEALNLFCLLKTIILRAANKEAIRSKQGLYCTEYTDYKTGRISTTIGVVKPQSGIFITPIESEGVVFLST